MQVIPIKTRVFRESEDLLKFIENHVESIEENTILVVTSKIVSLAESRTHEIVDARTKEELIKKESQWAMRTKYTWLTIKDEMVMASAGIDESNADGKLILLPKDSHQAAQSLRDALRKKHGLKNLGVLITDSRIFPLRAGASGIALAYTGFSGIRDYRGKKDIFGREFRVERNNMADSLATAAVMVMGEGAEQQPLALIKNAPVEFTDSVDKDELKIDVRDDLYEPLFEHIKEIKWNNNPGAVLDESEEQEE